MLIKSIYMNLPIKSVERTRAFWTSLGFKINEEFSDDRAISLEIKEGLVYAMLISQEMFATFTHRPIADGSTTQVLIALEVESREDVDLLVQKAVESGGSRYLTPSDEGWMYYDRFMDIDGHQWEVMFTDMSLMPDDVKGLGDI